MNEQEIHREGWLPAEPASETIEADHTWLLTEQTRLTKVTDLEYQAERIGTATAITLTFGPDGDLLVGGRYYDFGDDYPCVLGMLDEAAMAPNGVAIFQDDTVTRI
jgi:hypothetical protein